MSKKSNQHIELKTTLIKLSLSSLPEDMNYSMVAPWNQGHITLIYVSRQQSQEIRAVSN